MSDNSDAAVGSGGGGRRPRGICSKCDRLVALTPRTGMIGHHGSQWGNQCPGRNKPPADAQSTADLMAELLAISTNLREHSANLQEYIERRAQEIAAASLADQERQGGTAAAHHAGPASAQRRVGQWARWRSRRAG